MPRRAAIEQFTDRFVRTALPGEYTERKLTGFALRVTNSGARRFSLRYLAPDGRQRRLILRETTLKDARAEALAARNGNKDPVAERRQARAQAKARSVRTMSDLFEDYAAFQVGRVRGSTLYHAKGLYTRYVQPAWGDLYIGDVTRRHAQALLGGLERQGLAVTRNRTRALIGALFNHASDVLDLAGIVNPVKGKSFKGPKESPRQRVFSDEELRALWRALDDPAASPSGVGPSVRLALMLAMVTLQRRCEVAEIDQSELNLGEGIWTIPGERAKNHQRHVVPLSPLALSIIGQAQMLNGGQKAKGPLFPSPKSGPLRPHALTRAMGRLREQLGIVDARVHDFRRTGASAMASERLGIARYVVSKVLNHTSDSGGGAFITTTTYAISDELPRKRDALNAWAALLKSVVNDAGSTQNVTLGARA